MKYIFIIYGRKYLKFLAKRNTEEKYEFKNIQSKNN
jgi:hypothetical protein